jgi:molybdopterin-guanine dinucleotide biosynthesis protein A
MTRDTLGAVIAGGLSSRFGSPKALAPIGDGRVVDRVMAALRAALGHDDIVCIANDPLIARAIGLPARGDVITGIGALAGVHAALSWAHERGCRGILAVGCDMPLLDAGLLRELLTHADDVDAVLPASEGPRGVEPLCAWYGTTCIEAIEAAVQAGDRRMIGFHDRVRVQRLPLEDVRRFGDPARLFMNLNTPADRDAAERLLAGHQR